MDNGIIQVISNHSFEKTYNNLKQALDENPKLTIVAEFNHSKNANKVGLSLNNSKIILFGNPNLGTPLMNSNITVGLDLPQKMLVFKKENSVIVAYNDLMYLKKRHQIEGKDELLNKISNALKSLSKYATE